MNQSQFPPKTAVEIPRSSYQISSKSVSYFRDHACGLKSVQTHSFYALRANDACSVALSI